MNRIRIPVYTDCDKKKPKCMQLSNKQQNYIALTKTVSYSHRRQTKADSNNETVKIFMFMSIDYPDKATVKIKHCGMAL